MSKKADYKPPKGLTYSGHSTFDPPKEWGAAPVPPKEVATAIKDNRKLMAHDNVLVYHHIQERTDGGLHIPERFVEKNKNHQAWLVAVGPDAHVNGWEAGQLVRVSQFAGAIVKDRSQKGPGRQEKMDIMRSESLLCRDWRLEEGI